MAIFAEMAGKLANSTIFRETGDNCLGILLHFSVVGSLLYSNRVLNYEIETP